jgi:hypothetical protein
MIKSQDYIQQPIFNIIKQDGYLIFLSGSGQEIARIKEERNNNNNNNNSYKLNLTESGRINLKDGDGKIVSFIQQLSLKEIAVLKKIIAGYNNE